jgi:MFS family permease
LDTWLWAGLLDRIAARFVMVAGALIAALAFIGASQANSFAPMVCAYLLLGLGISAATLIPASFVVANWFKARRGFAMGIVASGASAGGFFMTVFAVHVICSMGLASRLRQSRFPESCCTDTDACLRGSEPSGRIKDR